MTHWRPNCGSRPLQAWLLSVLLLVAQGLGLAHRVAHAPHAHLPGRGGATAAHADPGHVHARAAPSWVDGHQADSGECRLIDQLAHTDGLCAAGWAPPQVPQAADAGGVAHAAAPRAGSASAYLARAPPLA